jgi:hypothetical protein
MNRRRFFRPAAVATAGVSAVGLGGWWVWDRFCKMGLTVGCQSDNLSTVAGHLREYADRHDGRFPPAAELLAVARGEHDSYLWCRRVGLPYQWDLRLAGSAVAVADGRAVAWCPPGGHGRYVGAIVVGGGELRAVGVTVAVLRQLVIG